MLCPNCNQPVDAASTYCSHCGCALPKEEPPTQTAPNGLPATNTMDINAELRKAEQKEHGFADMFYKAEGRLNRKPYILRVLVLQVVGFCLQHLTIGRRGCRLLYRVGSGVSRGIRAVCRMADAGAERLGKSVATRLRRPRPERDRTVAPKMENVKKNHFFRNFFEKKP